MLQAPRSEHFAVRGLLHAAALPAYDAQSFLKRLASAGETVYHQAALVSKTMPNSIGSSGTKSAIPVLSFFTGAGLLDVGFRRAGFKSVWHNEFHQPFVHGFEHGMRSLGASEKESTVQNKSSVVEVGPKQILSEAFDGTGVVRPFGVIGGPPCPDFSVGGKNKGSSGERGQLSRVYTNRIHELRPDFFLFENVAGLLRTTKHRSFLIHLLQQLSEQYLLDVRVVNALEYGVPQDRERLIVVGLYKSWLRRHGRNASRKQNPELLVHHARHRSLNEHALPLDAHWLPWDKFRTHPGAKEIYSWPDTHPFGHKGLPPERPQNVPLELTVGPLICDVTHNISLPNGADAFVPYSKRFTTVAEGDVSKKCFKRLHRWRFSPAAAYGNNEVHLHPTHPRRLTVREAMKIQTVPDAYSLPPDMTLSDKFKTIGNAVPVRLAEAVARSLRQVLDDILAGRDCANI